MKQLDKQYQPSEHEAAIYERWEKSGAFQPDEQALKQGKEAFVLMLPLPNITGSLHMGHALQHTIMDIVVRYHRMTGQPTLWMPGTDHAAIATNKVIEQQLHEEGTSRQEIGRDAFIKRTEEWYDKTGAEILQQMKRLGCTCDWSRTRFTMDDDYYAAVQESFIRYYNRGLIYRGDRIVNWDPVSGSTVSDLEIDWLEETAPFYTFKYGPFEIGTARPETKFGDKYVVMHPDDKRYATYHHGDTFEAEWINGPITATIIKDDAIDPTFGTGVMTITPWHDATDFAIAERHNLDKEQIIDFDGKLLPIAGDLKGQTIEEARPKIIDKLTAKGLLVSVDDNYQHRIARNDRGKGLIEPQIMRQWFVDMDKLKPETIEVAEKELIEFLPPRWKKNFLNWMHEVYDWNITRQIWLGHRLPVWYKQAPRGLTITFIRHGQSAANKQGNSAGHHDSPLTAAGRAQADQQADALKDLNVTAVYTSDLSRAADTADRIFGSRDIPISKDQRLREADFGDLTMKTTDEVRPHRQTGFPGGETYQDVRDRTLRLLADLIDQHDGEHIAIVAHNGTWKALENIVHGHSLTGDLVMQSTDNATPLEYTIDHLTYVATEPPPGDGWEQDPDVLDTWFSSALWPFATLGWPHNTADLKNYYPGTVLITARDILYLWVARMIFSGLELMKGEEYDNRSQEQRIPFKHVFIHPTVLTKDGQRMSKSLGTGIDPLELIDTYGADATRFGLMNQMSYDNQAIRFDESDVKAGRNFANKIWNVARLLESLPENTETTIADRWIAERQAAVHTEVTDLLAAYKIGEAARLLYDFFWHDFADWYVEILKVGGDTKLAHTVFTRLLITLHPFMPHLTEVLWHHFEQPGDLLTTSWSTATEAEERSFPLTRETEGVSDTSTQPLNATPAITHFRAAITTIRQARRMLDLAPNQPINIHVANIHPSLQPALAKLARADSVDNPTDDMLRFPLPDKGELFLGSDQITDDSLKQARAKLTTEYQQIDQQITKQRHILDQMNTKAPPAAITAKQHQLDQLTTRHQELKQSLNLLERQTPP